MACEWLHSLQYESIFSICLYKPNNGDYELKTMVGTPRSPTPAPLSRCQAASHAGWSPGPDHAGTQCVCCDHAGPGTGQVCLLSSALCMARGGLGPVSATHGLPSAGPVAAARRVMVMFRLSNICNTSLG